MILTGNVSFDDTKVAFSYKSDRQLKKANLIFSIVNIPWLSRVAQRFAMAAVKMRLPVTGLVRSTVYEHFCGGETADQVERTIRALAGVNMNVILHYALEGSQSEHGYEQTVKGALHSIAIASRNANVPFCVLKVTGVGSLELLEKVQSGSPLDDTEARAFERLRQRVARVCEEANRAGISLLIDAEETWIQEPIDELAAEMMKKYNRTRAVIFNTFQLYRKDMVGRLKEAYSKARSEGYMLGAKLVRGAYVDKERERARSMGYASPIQDTKSATDADFNAALSFCIENREGITAMCGSHNEYSNGYLFSGMVNAGLSPSDPHFWFAQLYGMSDHISFNLVKAGCNVAKYLPYGPVRSVMPYLIRRAQENTSVADQSSRELLLVRKELRRRKQQGDSGN